MREFFEAVDAGRYDAWIIGLGMLVAFVLVLDGLRQRRRRHEFFAAQHTAQESFEKLGPDHIATQMAVMEALNAWCLWRRRRTVPTLAQFADEPSEEEWHAISLLQAMPDGTARHAM